VRACESYYPFQEQEAANLVRALLSDPTDIGNKLPHAAAAATGRALYSGPSLTQEDEEKVRRVDWVGSTVLASSMPMAFLVDVIPVMKRLPAWAAGWKRWGENFFTQTDEFFTGLLQEGKEQKVRTLHHTFIRGAQRGFCRKE
jgi:hypothetical protein